MEIKIKQNNQLIDASIEIVDGVMVVFPLGMNPKDGDIVATEDGEYIGIFKRWKVREEGLCETYFYFDNEDNDIITDDLYIERMASECEENLLFDKLNEKGFKWNPEKKALERDWWIPEEGEEFYRITLTDKVFSPQKRVKDSGFLMDGIFKNQVVFRTEEACQAVCDNMNEIFRTTKQ